MSDKLMQAIKIAREIASHSSSEMQQVEIDSMDANAIYSYIESYGYVWDGWNWFIGNIPR